MELGYVLIALSSLVMAAQSIYTSALMLYAWEDQDKQRLNQVPASFIPPQLSFTAILPARHEEKVIADTMQRLVELSYPREMVEILIVIEAGDSGTIAKVNQKLSQLQAQGITNARLITFSDGPINKPHGLNVALKEAKGEIVTIFDAEDEPHPEILQLVNTIMCEEKVPVVQCGVQLMNHADHWFSALNVLEYFFWFKSRLHYHTKVGMVTLGGNTVFIERDLLNQYGGWDDHCLTEDADIGIRLSVNKVPIRVVYDHKYVTKEETPPSSSQFIKQRARWNQGFLQILAKGDWRKLPTLHQRLMALYTLSFSLVQVVMLLYIPLSLWLMLAVKLPILVTLISMLPLYVLVIQYLINLAGLYEFTSLHHLKAGWFAPIKLAVVFLPYQWLQSISAVRATWRYFKGINNWEKTEHVGAHRLAGGLTLHSPTDHLYAAADGSADGGSLNTLLPVEVTRSEEEFLHG